MYIVNGIAYAGDKPTPVRVSGVRPLDGHRLWLRFNNGETKIFNFSPLLTAPAFAPLTDKQVFSGVYIDRGVTVWNDGEIDIAPEYLYENAASAEDIA